MNSCLGLCLSWQKAIIHFRPTIDESVTRYIFASQSMWWVYYNHGPNHSLNIWRYWSIDNFTMPTMYQLYDAKSCTMYLNKQVWCMYLYGKDQNIYHVYAISLQFVHRSRDMCHSLCVYQVLRSKFTVENLISWVHSSWIVSMPLIKTCSWSSRCCGFIFC